MSGLRTSLKDPDLNENLYVYDNAGRLSKEQIAASQTAYYTYDASGLVTRRDMPGNVVIAYMTYDAKSGRLSELKQHQGALGLQTKSYVRNENGAIVRVDTNGTLDYFSYDALDRLVHDAEPLAGPDGTNNYYTYDAASNRARKDNRLSGLETATYCTYDARNLLTREHLWDPPSTATTTYYDHDAAQRMTRQRSTASATYFAFTQRDQIARLQNVSASPDPIQYFSYSGADERVRVADGDGEAYWSFDGEKLLREKTPGGGIVARYRHNFLPGVVMDFEEDPCPEPRTIGVIPGYGSSPVPQSSLLQATFTPDGGGGPLTTVPRYDERGSVTRMISLPGDVVESYSYDRFGVTQATGGKQRQRLVIGGPFVATNVSQGAYLRRGNLWLSGPGITCGGAGRGLGHLLGGGLTEEDARSLANQLFDLIGPTLLAQDGGSVIPPACPVFCGPDVTDAIVEHFNQWLNPNTRRTPWRWLTSATRSYTDMALELREIANHNYFLIINDLAKDSKPSCGTPGICDGTVTFGGKCLTAYQVRHIFMMVYMWLNFSDRLSRAFAFAHELFFDLLIVGFTGDQRVAGNTFGDQAINESLFEVGELLESREAAINSGGKAISRDDIVDVMSRVDIVAGQKERMAKGLNRNDYFARCKPCDHGISPKPFRYPPAWGGYY